MSVGVHHSFVTDDNNDPVDYRMVGLAAVRMNAFVAVRDMQMETFVVEMRTDVASRTEKVVGCQDTENSIHSP